MYIRVSILKFEIILLNVYRDRVVQIIQQVY